MTMSDKSLTSTSAPKQNHDGSSTHTMGSALTASDISLKSDVKGLGTDVKSIAGDVAREAQKLAESRLDTGKGFVAEGFGSVAGAIRSTGEQLRESPAAPVSSYLGTAADSIQQASKYLENKSVGEVVSDVEDFARREPLIFLGGTFAVGLLLGRFLKSASPEGRRERKPEQRDDRGYEAGQSERVSPARGERGGFDPASQRTGSFGAGPSMGGTTTGGNMGAGKLPPLDSPLTPGPITAGPFSTGPLTSGPVSTQASVGTDLPVNQSKAVTPLHTTGQNQGASTDARSVGENHPSATTPSSGIAGGTISFATGSVKKSDV